MQANTKQIEIVMSAQVGPMNDIRKQKITEAIGPGFVMGNVNLPGAVAFVNQSAGITVIITDAQIGLRLDGQDINADFSQMSKVLDSVRDTLLLDDRMPAAVQIVGHVLSDAPTTEISVEHFGAMTGDELRRRFNGLRGVGLRITFEQPPYTCDLHIEPFYADPTVFYIRFGAASQSPTSVSHLMEDAAKFQDYSRKDALDFIESMIVG
ncbi:MAG: hypothetical protein WCO51_05200 [bacterium]|jgi:hypothetical protein